MQAGARVSSLRSSLIDLSHIDALHACMPSHVCFACALPHSGTSHRGGVENNVCTRSCLAFARHSKFCLHGIYFKMAVIVSNYDRDRK